MSASSALARSAMPRETRQGQDGRVRSDLRIEVSADARRARRAVPSHRARRSPSSSMSLVIAASPGRSAGSADAPTGSSARKLTSGTASMLNRPHAKAVRAACAGESREIGERGSAPSGGRRDRDRRGITTPRTGSEPASASSVRPRGTTLSSTRRVRPQPFARRALHRCRRDPPIAIQVALKEPGIANKDVVGVQLIRLAAKSANGLQPDRRNWLRPAPGIVPFPVRSGPRRRASSIAVGNGALEFGERAAGRGGRDDLKVAAELARILRRGNLGRHPFLVDQRAIEARGLSARQHFRDQIELRIVFGEQRRRVPADVQPRQLDSIFEQQTTLDGDAERRCRTDHRRRIARRLRARRNTARARSMHRPVSTSPASASDAFARAVVGLEKRAHIVEPRGADIIGRTDGHPVIRMTRLDRAPPSAPCWQSHRADSRSSGAAHSARLRAGSRTSRR